LEAAVFHFSTLQPAIPIILVLLTGTLAPAQNDQRTDRAGPNPLARLPVHFVENRGLLPEQVAYFVHASRKSLFFTREGVTILLHPRKSDGSGWAVKLEFVAPRPGARPEGDALNVAVVSHFSGAPEDWCTGLRSYSRIVYADLWPGIDLVYTGTTHEVKYAFLVEPGADPSRIRLRYRGATRVTVRDDGALEVCTPVGCFRDAAPSAFQEIGGERKPVDMAFSPVDDGTADTFTFGFDLGPFDPSARLVLDPSLLVYCGYIGGTKQDGATSVAIDARGYAYVAGAATSPASSFPVNVGPFLQLNGFGPDAFVAKVDPSGRTLIYCGYIGGNGHDSASGIAVDAAGNAYISGSSNGGTGFPAKGGPVLNFSGSTDGFVARVNATGTALDYCGYIGGFYLDHATGIAVDAAGSAYVVGSTASTQASFPVTVGPDLTFNGASYTVDGFVAKIHPQGTSFLYCGYIGGVRDDRINGVAVDTTGNAYVVGDTASDETSFPVNLGPDVTFNGVQDVFVAKIDWRGTRLRWSGYVGGSDYELGEGVALDAAGNVYVTGMTNSDERTFPVLVGPDLTYNRDTDAFVARVNGQTARLDYCGYIGGSGGDFGNAVAVDGQQNAYVVGSTESNEASFPVKSGPDLTYNGGICDAFVCEVSPSGSGLIYAGYIGGAQMDGADGIAVDASGSAYVVGMTGSDEKSFPVKVGPGLTFKGQVQQNSSSAFVAKVPVLVGIVLSGSPRLGGTVTLTITARADAGLPYQVGTSLGRGPIPIDRRVLALSPDGLLAISVSGAWPTLFVNYRGALDANGQAGANIHILPLPALVGVRLHSAFVTLQASAPSGIKTISETASFSISR